MGTTCIIETVRSKIVAVIIPVYNNEDSIVELASRIRQVFSELSAIDFLLIFVDDGSSDGSWEQIKKIHEIIPENSRALKLTRNFGQLAAMYAGYSSTKVDSYISISADLQDSPELILKLVESWEDGHDLVAAKRDKREDELWSKLTSKIAYKLLRSDLKSLPEGGFDYFLMDSKVRDRILNQKGRHRFLQGELLLASKNPKFIGYTRLKRKHGVSGYSFKKRLSNFLDASTDSSYGLIRNVTNVGFSMIFICFMLLLVIVAGAFLGRSPFKGFLLLSTAIISFGAIQIFLSGIILEYMWRIYDISRNKSFYEIGEEI